MFGTTVLRSRLCVPSEAGGSDQALDLGSDRDGAGCKRLEGGKFVWPQVRDGVMRMSGAQFAALFEGVDWRMVRPERARRPLAAG